ncbi:MAG: hypothetical protein KJO66_05625, partial [Gammaproteobacteria bacterium]|nr:hypothetical protein [Gammaproteobacteria bacterium]
MHKNRSRNRSPGACLLLVAGPACAHGGLSSLGALHAALMMAVGLGGVVLAAFLIAAVRTGIRNDRAGNWAKAGLFLGASYVFVSLSFYLTSPEYEYSKFPGVVGAIVLALLCVFFLRHRKRARALVLATIGIVTAVLVLVPAQFWKGNAFDLVETIFVDNSAGLVVLPWSGDRDSVRQLLLTEDGREILQFGRIADSDDVGELFDQLPGDRVLLERIDTGRAGEWYDVRHYVADPRYEATRSMPWNKPRHSL